MMPAKGVDKVYDKPTDDPDYDLCREPGCIHRWSLSPWTQGGRGFCWKHAHLWLKDDGGPKVTPNVTPHLEKLADVLPRLKVPATA